MMRSGTVYAIYVALNMAVIIVAGAITVAIPQLVRVPVNSVVVEHPGMPMAVLALVGMSTWALLSVALPKRRRARPVPVK